MSEQNSNSKGIFFLGLFLAMGFVISSFLMVSGIVKIKLSSQKKIFAKGTSERQVVSDLAILNIEITTKGADLKTATEQNRKKLEQVLSFLEKQSVKTQDYSVSPPSVQDSYKESRDEKDRVVQTWDGYNITQNISVESKQVDLIGKVHNAYGSLLDEGVLVNFSNPEYLFTDTAKIKMDLLAEATKNARDRANQIVKNSGSATNLGALLSSSQGIFQITPLYSTDTSGEGMNDTTSFKKSIRVVVSVEYALE